MAKVAPPRKRGSRERNTNWLLIGGISALGIIGLFALLFVTLQGQGQPTPTPEPVASLADFCEANEDNCIAQGDEDAPVTVIEVSDYGCPHCRDFNLGGTAEALYESYVDSGDVRWVVLPYALRAATQPPAAAAMCAAEQDQFFPYHHELFEFQDANPGLTRDGFVQAAENVGLDVGAFEDCIDGNRYRSVVQRNVSVAASAGVSATPTFFVNGVKMEGNQPLANFQQQLDQMLGSG
ncbi:MAG: DsbA family protein [Chloroflexota bacterium]